MHWAGTLKPILRSYHAGELHFDWKTPFLKYVIERKIATTQDIDWPEFLVNFPTQTIFSMTVYLTNVLRKNVSDQPFYKRLIDILPTLKHTTERSSAAKHREQIVFLYDKVRGIS
jgi:hypothetical protein